MKTKIICLYLLSSLFIFQCKKEDKKDDNFINATPTAVITAKIDGHDFQALSSAISMVYDTLNNRYKLTANQHNERLTIELSSIQTGQYPIDFDHYLISLEKDSVIYDGGNSPQGVIEITSVQSGKFSGTFSATVKNLFSGAEIQITEGVITTVPY